MNVHSLMYPAHKGMLADGRREVEMKLGYDMLVASYQFTGTDRLWVFDLKIASDDDEEPITTMDDYCASWAHDGIPYIISDENTIGSDTPGSWNVRGGMITSADPDQTVGWTTHAIPAFTGPEVHWLINQAGTCSSFKILVVERPGSPLPWRPYFDLDGCTSSHYRVSTGGKDTGYQAQLASMGIPDTYGGAILGWATATNNNPAGGGWPYHINIEADPDPGLDAQYDFYISWTP